MMKKGLLNISIMFFGITIIFIITFVYLMYFQVGILTEEIKNEVYYILMDTNVELNKKDLPYNKFTLNELELENRLDMSLLKLKNKKMKVTNIKVEELLTNINNDNVIIELTLKVTFEPLIKIKNELSFKITDRIKLNLLQYE